MCRNYTYQEQKLINGFKLTNPHVCIYCNKELKGDDTITIDHKTPICRGGETIEENLAISCLPCNREKDDMTVEEYIIYKQRKQELNQRCGIDKIIENLIDMQTNIMTKSTDINNKLIEAEKEINSLQQEIMYGNFNACEGFMYTKTLNELLLRREELRISKIGYNYLNAMIGNHKKTTIDIKDKIQTEVSKEQRLFIKKIVVGKKRNKSKIVNLELVQSAK